MKRSFTLNLTHFLLLAIAGVGTLFMWSKHEEQKAAVTALSTAFEDGSLCPLPSDDVTHPALEEDRELFFVGCGGFF